MDELNDEVVDAMTADDFLLFYENECGDQTNEMVDNHEINEHNNKLDAMTVEEILSFYENNNDEKRNSPFFI